MRRRHYIAAAGAAISAGCTGILGGGEGPKYDPGDEPEMRLAIEDFPPDWDVLGNAEEDEEYDISFSDNSLTQVVAQGVNVHETVSDAVDEYEAAIGRVGNPNDYPVADTAIWYVRDTARTVFRDSNAVGYVSAARISGGTVEPDIDLAQDYTEITLEKWAEL